MPAERRGPPESAARLLAGRLPREWADTIVGDLEEEYRTRILPDRGRLRADLWFWKNALFLRRRALRDAARRLRRVRPSHASRSPRDHPDDGRGWRALMDMHALRYAVRRLSRSPGFTAVAVLSLAIGIGANTAIFSVVNALLIRELPIADPDRVVEVYTSEENGYAYGVTSFPDYVDLRDQADFFSDVVAYQLFFGRAGESGGQNIVLGELVSGNYFSALGLTPAVGRGFLPEEDRTPGAHAVAVLGHDFWTREYGADPSIVGSTLRLNGRTYDVVGVAPEGFQGMFPGLVADVYVPLMMQDVVMPTTNSRIDRRGSHNLFLKARLAEGVEVEQADQAIRSFSERLAELHPDTNTGRLMSVLPTGDVSLHPFVDRALLPVAGLLLAVVGLVLVIACANLASFLLARAEDRRKEIAVRLALGASRGNLVGQLLVETVLLGVLGGTAGLVLAQWTLALLVNFQPPIPVPLNLDLSLDRTVLAFTAGVSVLAGVAFGLLPALQATNPDVAPTLKDESAGGRGRFRLRNATVVVQVALSFLLLIGAGLFVRSLQKAQRVDPGFDTGAAAVIWPDLPLSGYEEEGEQQATMRSLKERLLAHPAIERVALADRVPLGAAIQNAPFLIPGHPSETQDGAQDVDNAHVSPEYFDVMGVRIVRGRGFRDSDVEGPLRVVVSEAFERRFFPEGAVGRTIETSGGAPIEIIGVAADTKVRTLGEAPRPYIYQLQGQPFLASLNLIVRGQGTSAELLAAAVATVRELDPDLVLLEAKTMDQHLSLLLFPPRMAALLLSVFGGLALLLSAIGIYGLVSHAVSRRTREVGIRVSMGASTFDVVTMVVGRGLRLVTAGAIVGVLLAGGVTWSLSSFLFGIGARDVATFVAIPVILMAVALVAAVIPARRAARIDPVLALRSE